jgi:hypothetical protein
VNNFLRICGLQLEASGEYVDWNGEAYPTRSKQRPRDRSSFKTSKNRLSRFKITKLRARGARARSENFGSPVSSIATTLSDSRAAVEAEASAEASAEAEAEACETPQSRQNVIDALQLNDVGRVWCLTKHQHDLGESEDEKTKKMQESDERSPPQPTLKRASKSPRAVGSADKRAREEELRDITERNTKPKTD